jgi:hypothetical protein
MGITGMVIMGKMGRIMDRMGRVDRVMGRSMDRVMDQVDNSSRIMSKDREWNRLRNRGDF